MKSFKAYLEEMAKPAPEHHEMQFYHGTSDEKLAHKILSDGHLRGRPEQGKSFLAPMKDHVYITPHIHYAQIYAIGGDVAGSEYHRINGEHGYVFAVHGKHLKDIHPDEDSVGGMLSHAVAKDGHEWMKDIPRLSWLAQQGRDHLHPTTFRKAINGEVAYQAKAGKTLNKIMSDHQKLELIRHGSHIAHHGPLQITKAWRIHKSKVPLLKRDGSNFFDHAEEVSLKESLDEAWHSSMKSPYKFDTSPIDIHKNPTAAETAKLIHNSGCKSLRGILHGNDAYVWDAERALHHDAENHLGFKGTCIDIGKDRVSVSDRYINRDSGSADTHGKNHPWIAKALPNHRKMFN